MNPGWTAYCSRMTRRASAVQIPCERVARGVGLVQLPVWALTGAYSVVRGGECAILAVMKEFAIPAVKAAIFRLREIQAKAFGSEEHGFQINPVFVGVGGKRL